MGALSRRQLLGGAAAIAGGAVAAACGGPSGSGGPSGGGGGLKWWDHQNQLEPAKRKIFEKFAKAPGGVPVEYTYNNPGRLGQTLQLAKQSNQLPDIHSNAGLMIPVPQLISGGWVSPLSLSAEATARLKDVLIEGVHVFDGKVYSFPIFDYHVYVSATWFNTKLVEQAGLDPEQPPATYDEFRASARKVQDASGGKSYGWIWNIGMPARLGEQINDFAQAAGFEGGGGVLFKTGEYAFHSQPYLDVIEFLLSLQKDKLLVPGAQAWLDDIARSRWTTGIAGYYFDGPWCAGVALKNAPQFGETLGVGPLLVPTAGKQPHTYHAHQGGEYWISPSTKHAKEANQLLSDYFTTPDYSVEIANTMSQPPRDLSAVAKSKAHPAYKKLVGWYQDQVSLAPNAIVKNPELTKVQAEIKDVKPTLGDIVQGAFTGDITDVKAALKKLSDQSTQARDAAVAAARKKGAKVDVSDYAFPNWKPGADFTTEMYG
ncbi:ABC transporter substrate-binding protein [Flindersiella endophytica]